MQRRDSIRLSASRLFPVSSGNKVKFYSNAYDAHGAHHASGAFADIFRELRAAKSHICIVGWALSPVEKFGEHEDTLPALLVKKASEEVRVILMIWDNIVPVYNWDHKKFILAVDAEIKKLPEDLQRIVRANLHIKFSTRELGYSDHQKMVVVDKALYMGGLDLISGRSDPALWHDTHVRLEGNVVLAAIDLIHARWDGVRQNDVNANQVSRQLRQIRYVVEAVNDKEKPPAEMNSDNCMQLLCSNKAAYWGEHHLWRSTANKKNRAQEVHQAHLDAIHGAERFIYMENQFFIGNRLHRNNHDTVLSSNLVIEAIVNKILSKISSGEDFHFYCQLPYRPEGDEHALDVRLMLRKQWKTIAWVIKAIDGAAKQHGKTAADYVTFYNLGQMKNSAYHMKYTHSKLMIVDDREIIIGSANCNERSMAGNRDSEVAVQISGYHDEIANFRERLMCEHFGEEFVNTHAGLLLQFPEREESVRLLQRRLESNLSQMPRAESPQATPWGNVPIRELMSRRKPEHVPHRTPLPSSLIMGALEWAKKMPL